MAHQAKLSTGSPQPRTGEPSRGLRVVHRRVNHELRGQVARALDCTLSALTASGHQWATNHTIASKIGIDESVIRDIRAGDSPLTLERLVEMLDPEHAASTLEYLASELRKGGGGRSGGPTFEGAVSELHRATARVVTCALEGNTGDELLGATMAASKAANQILLTRKEGK